MTLRDGVNTMIATAERAGVADSANQPFLLLPQQPTERAVLLVHGFTASPWEMQPVAGMLRAQGFASLAVRLAGHGTSPEDLASRCWQEWRDDVAVGYRLLAAHYRRVYAVGVSTGALLLLHGALTDPYAGLGLVSPYLRLRHRLASWAGVLRWFVPCQQVTHPEEVLPYYYSCRPLAGVQQLNRLVATLVPRLADVRTPLLIQSGGGDKTIDVASTHELFDRLGAADKIFHQFGLDGPHVLCGAGSPVKNEALNQISAFFKRLEDEGVKSDAQAVL